MFPQPDCSSDIVDKNSEAMWTVDRLGPDAHQIEFEENFQEEGWEQWLLVTGDRHWDNRHSDWDLQKKHLELAKERNAPVIDVGDFFCLMQGKYDKRKSSDALRDIHRGEEYFDDIPRTAVDFFKPYASQFAVIGHGNHETAIIKHHQTDVLARFAYRLNSETGSNVQVGGYGGYVKIRFVLPGGVKRKSLWVRYHHGHGGGGRVTRGTLISQRNAEIYGDADIVVTGHIHERWRMEIVREKITDYGKVVLKPQIHLCTSTYKQEYNIQGGWHYERGAPPKPLGGWWVRFTWDGSQERVVFQTMETL